MRTIAIVDACDTEGAGVADIANHEGFDAYLVLKVERGPTPDPIMDRIRGGERVVLFELPAEAPPSVEKIVGNAFRHFGPDYCVVIPGSPRLACSAELSPKRALLRPGRWLEAGRRRAAGIRVIQNPYRTRRRAPISVRARRQNTQAPGPGPDPGRDQRWGATDTILRRVASIGYAGSPRAPEASGVFASEHHLAKPYLDLPPFAHAWDRFAPESVLDIGCGLGGYLGYFIARGSREVMGVDGFDPTDHYLGGDGYIQHDLREPLHLGQTFDLVVCTEVIEHLEPEHASTLIDSITRHARDVILFSGARPGQPGDGHVNCRPIEEWLDAFDELGWRPDVFDSLALRSLSSFHWFRRNLLILRPKTHPLSDTFTDADLDCFECGHVEWTDQEPGVCIHPLARGLPPLSDDGRQS